MARRRSCQQTISTIERATMNMEHPPTNVKRLGLARSMVIACRNVWCRTQVRALPCIVSPRLTLSMMRELPLIISYITSPPLTECHQELTSTAIYWLSTTKYQPFLSYTDPVHSFTTSKRTVEQTGSSTMFLYLCI